MSYGFTRYGVKHVDSVKEEHSMGRGCICREWVGDVGLKHHPRKVNNNFNTTMDTDTKLTTGEEVQGKIIGEVSKQYSADEVLEAGADANWAEFERISGGFVKS
jgi:hypothetical protein